MGYGTLFSATLLTDTDKGEGSWSGVTEEIFMKQKTNGLVTIHYLPTAGRYAFILLVFLGLAGCSVWNGYVDPDYGSSRADQLCHPYAQCSQGNWVASDGMGKVSTVAKKECQNEVDQRFGNGWWSDSVSRGIEIGRCMEKKGYRLQQ